MTDLDYEIPPDLEAELDALALADVLSLEREHRYWAVRAGLDPKARRETKDRIALMEEPPGGENHGRLDGKQLSTYAATVRDYFNAHAQGWHIPWRNPTGFPTGRPPVVTPEMTTPEALAEIRRQVGFTQQQFEQLAGRSRQKRDPEQRAALAAAIDTYASERKRGAITLMTLAYGTSRWTIIRLRREAP